MEALSLIPEGSKTIKGAIRKEIATPGMNMGRGASLTRLMGGWIRKSETCVLTKDQGSGLGCVH